MAFVIYVFLPFSQETLRRDYSQTILAKDSTILRVFLNDEQQWCLSPKLQSTVPNNLKVAVTTFEDQYFDYHSGVNPLAIARAIYLNVKNRRVVSGGSTITMQLARMIKRQPRTLENKFLEMLLALKLEWKYSKEEILKDYLTHAPYGSNIRGYLAASHRYFGKEPRNLTWSEAATLAVLPNAPGLIFPTKNTDKLLKKRNALLLRLFEDNEIDSETYELSLLEKIPDHIFPFPLAAPHLTDRIHSENQLPVIVTSIDQHIQSETDFFVKQHSSQLAQMGIENACAMVVDNTSGNVLSYVGSQDYNDLDHHGRVDGIRANRSSGSILKPFLYALSLDEGLVLPKTLIKDVPTYFESFVPSNASEKFQGIVPANQALIHSLNVPAVRLLNAYGVSNFYNSLKAAGVESLFRNADDYGLPLILGGAEVNPWDMAAMYRGISRGGIFEGISFYQSRDQNLPNEQRLVSGAASYLVLEELKELIRPGLEFYWKKYSSQVPIAWKTGTSYGHKDAWAVGTTPQWTIVVWVGNFEGLSNKNISGMRSAGPLLFSILNALPVDQKLKWFEPNRSDFMPVKICKETGFYPNEFCENIETVNAPQGMKPLKICPYHQRFFLSPDHKHVVCSHCWSGNQVAQTFLKYTPDVNYYLRENGNLIVQEPEHNPACPIGKEQGVLEIIYPRNNTNVFVPKDFDGKYQPIIGRVATQFPNRELFWYIDDEFLGSSLNNSSLPLNPLPGNHTLTIVDTEGNKDQVKFSATRN